MAEKSAVNTRKLLGSASTAMIGLSAFFIAAPVLGLLELCAVEQKIVKHSNM